MPWSLLRNEYRMRKEHLGLRIGSWTHTEFTKLLTDRNFAELRDTSSPLIRFWTRSTVSGSMYQIVVVGRLSDDIPEVMLAYIGWGDAEPDYEVTLVAHELTSDQTRTVIQVVSGWRNT
jgi:hypothetical protein